jgi:MFS family permease
MELRFFRAIPFSGAVVTAVTGYCGYASFLFVNTLYLQDVRGFSALRAGLCTLPVAVLVVLLAPISGRIVARWGPRVPMMVAGTGMASAGLAFTRLTPTASLAALVGGYLLFGLGQGMINPPTTNAAVSAMPTSMAGLAASVASTSRQTGTALGVAISGSIVGSTLTEGGTVFTAATHTVWWLVFGLGVVIVCLGLVTTSGWALDTARRTAALFDQVDAGVTWPASSPARRPSRTP